MCQTWITLKYNIAILRASAFLYAHAIECTADHTGDTNTKASKVRTECYWQQTPCKAFARAKARAMTGATEAQANFSISRTEAPLTSTSLLIKLLIELAFLRMVSTKCNIHIDVLKIEHMSSMLLLVHLHLLNRSRMRIVTFCAYQNELEHIAVTLVDCLLCWVDGVYVSLPTSSSASLITISFI